MKIKSAVSICLRNESLILCDETVGETGEVRQWIGDGAAFYLLEGLPYLNEDTVFRVFDITEKQQGKIYFRKDIFPATVDPDDHKPDDMNAEPGMLSINYGGNTYVPYVGGGKLVYINREYMAPFRDKADGLSLVIRDMENGLPYLVVMFGLLTIGIIMPFDPYKLEPIAENLEALAKLTRKHMKKKDEGEEE